MRLASATDSWVADTLASPQRVMRCSAASPVMVSPPSMQKHSTISPPRISSTPADSPRRGTTMPSPTAGASAGRTRARAGSEWNTGVPSGSAGRTSRGGESVDGGGIAAKTLGSSIASRSEEHTSELQSLTNLVCRLLLEKKKDTRTREQYRD